MEEMNFGQMKQLETVVAKKSERVYVKVASTEAGGKLFANFEWELQPYPTKTKDVYLPACSLMVRFASNGGSWGMEERENGSQLGSDLTNLEKFAFPVCLAGPIVYTQERMKSQDAVKRLFEWLERQVKKNKATLEIDCAYLEELFESKVAGKLEKDPITLKFPGEVAKVSLKIPEPPTS